ncbi:MAG: phytoene/squalene synthase family protein [Candidatus Korarchaeota archaeon]|nr:phytoene/squalene synthase family protein [Candidatus Korarchaeota archaeon]NIU84211.1 squalene/phytoene synthase family protein [Candidatus Thorarchaeota archaeon]NIW14363.1 squalene/phytoene synthase family protein [Candidatus Thorarchaeota archaeon]NIW52449.1 squalene/phytoene synthase family protein [Candidatus Korarchaeota archaeon]
MHHRIYSIFKQGSTTYFYSSIFFPKEVKDDVFTLYSFVRIPDNFVDSVPQQPEKFYEFKELYDIALEGKKTRNVVIDSFIELQERKEFEQKWIDAFFHSMEMDLTIDSYETIEDLKTYLYGSAEVIGLMMAKVMDLPRRSYQYARYLGRAMQYINFIRDIEEDLQLGRVYFPKEELRQFKIDSLLPTEVAQHKSDFVQFIRKQIKRYFQWQNKAEKGLGYIPRRYLIPIRTASEMYKWTANQIFNYPLIVYERKVKPSVSKIVIGIFKNVLRGHPEISPLIEIPRS